MEQRKWAFFLLWRMIKWGWEKARQLWWDSNRNEKLTWGIYRLLHWLYLGKWISPLLPPSYPHSPLYLQPASAGSLVSWDSDGWKKLCLGNVSACSVVMFGKVRVRFWEYESIAVELFHQQGNGWGWSLQQWFGKCLSQWNFSHLLTK